MSKGTRRFLIGAGALAGLLVLILIYVGLFFDVNRYKPQIETAVSNATGMKLALNGKISLKIFPRLWISLRDIHLSRNGNELLRASAIQVTPQFFPWVLHHELILDHVALQEPRIHIDKKRQEAGSSKSPLQGAPRVRSLSVNNGELIYSDQTTGNSIYSKGVNAEFSDLGWDAHGNFPSAKSPVKALRVHGTLQARSIQIKKWVMSDLKVKLQCDQGLIHLEPTTATAFGGRFQGSAQIDLRGPTLTLRIAQTASHIELSQLPFLSRASHSISGLADAVLNLVTTGNNTQAMLKSAKGSLSVRGQNIMLIGTDVDELADKLKAAENLNLVQIASQFFSSLLGQATGPEGDKTKKKSVIEKLVFDWQIKDGIAQAQDVAFSTSKTRVAFNGSINLVDQIYQHFFAATVDSSGCAKNKIEIVGPLNQPHPAERKASETCDHFYSGAIAQNR